MTTMIGLGVGIDYSLLVVTRFREELGRGLRRREAAVSTMVTAGSAVITSGLTVVVGFGALLFTPLIETRSVGIGGLIVVAVAVLLSITLLPALLAMLGREIDRPRWLARRLTWYHAPQVWEKWARTLARHPIRAMVYGGVAHRDPHRAALLDPDRAARRATGGPPAPRRARGSTRSRGWASRGTSSRSGCWWRCRRDAPRSRPPRSAGSAPSPTRSAPIRGCARSGAWWTSSPGRRSSRYSVLYSDLESAREQYPELRGRLPQRRPAARAAGRDPRRHHVAHLGDGPGAAGPRAGQRPSCAAPGACG